MSRSATASGQPRRDVPRSLRSRESFRRPGSNGDARLRLSARRSCISRFCWTFATRWNVARTLKRKPGRAVGASIFVVDLLSPSGIFLIPEAWPWIAFNAAVIAILAIDLGLFNKKARRFGKKGRNLVSSGSLWLPVLPPAFLLPGTSRRDGIPPSRIFDRVLALDR